MCRNTSSCAALSIEEFNLNGITHLISLTVDGKLGTDKITMSFLTVPHRSHFGCESRSWVTSLCFAPNSTNSLHVSRSSAPFVIRFQIQLDRIHSSMLSWTSPLSSNSDIVCSLYTFLFLSTTHMLIPLHSEFPHQYKKFGDGRLCEIESYSNKNQWSEILGF